METQLSICINSGYDIMSTDIEFFNAEKWNVDSEAQLLQHLYELLEVVRPHGKNLKIHLIVEVDNVILVKNSIEKKRKHEFVFKDQKLTMREIEILGLIMQGFTNKEISLKLFISFETVRSHRKNILEKTRARNTAALINHYHQTFFEK